MTTLSVFRFGEPDYVQLAGLVFIVLGVALIAYNAVYGEMHHQISGHPGGIEVDSRP